MVLVFLCENTKVRLDFHFFVPKSVFIFEYTHLNNSYYDTKS